MLTVAVLGPVEARRDGERLAVPSGKTTELLVRLAFDAGRPVRAERLLDELWGGARTARNTLQAKVSQLRRALGDAEAVASGPDGYTLRIDPDGVDALRAVRLADAAGEARRAGDHAAAHALAAEALALFRGELDGGDWIEPHRVRLEEVRLGLLEDSCAARVEAGTGGGELIGELEALVRDHPLREGLWHSLVTALYRAGRQADALAACARARTVLADELGLDPGPALQALEARILQRPSIGNLPGFAAPLVGRAADLEALAGLVRDRRLVTVTGTAGVGKTRLAIELARGLAAPGGVWLVRLDAIDDAAFVPHVVAETLHVPGGGAALAERLAAAETVLVLDNCEHVAGAVAALAARLLDAAPRLRVLATSQVPLGLDGEALYVLEPFPLADSVALFAARAAEIRHRFVLDPATEQVVAEVCRSLDGLPLAIELAAARVRSLSVQEIARRLGDRFTLLRDPTGRRRALAAAITWSYDLLFPDDQRGLWALAAFPGGAPLPGAERVLVALGVPPAAVLDVADRLVDRSLATPEIAAGGAVRYRLLDSIRTFALDRLQESGAAADAQRAQAAWYAETAAWCAATVRGAGQPDCAAFVRAERANIDAALAWCAEHDPPLGARIANGFGWTWVVLGDGVAGAARVRAALVPDPRERATGLLLAGWLEASAGDVARAAADLDEAFVLAADLDDDRLRADVERHRAFLHIQEGRPHDVLEAAEASLIEYRRLGLAWETAASLLLAEYGSIMLGDTAGAARAAGEAAALLAPIGDPWGTLHAEAMLGAIAHAELRFADAAGALTRAADAADLLGFLGQAALHLTTLGRVQHRAGDPTAATATLHRAIAAANTSGDLRITATARLHLARILRTSGSRAEARELLRQNDLWYRAAGGGDGALLTRCLLAGSVPELEAVLAEARAAGDRETQVHALDALARRAEADALAVTIPHLLDEADRLRAV
ncbi:BTAD domain-containing putative transcriptional regulator [Dactylosporangium sp. CS-033363]|uniref:BTAD domain-containing putative transcriptional regulator n=1 Tax=Dactylosporangium sp. CS-033363 TaxID=3239935 RepID=UPI003D93DF65